VQERLPLRIQRDEVQLLKNRLEESLLEDHRQAMRPWDWEFIIGKCLQLPANLDGTCCRRLPERRRGLG
jgi:hypothetical protein